MRPLSTFPSVLGGGSSGSCRLKERGARLARWPPPRNRRVLPFRFGKRRGDESKRPPFRFRSSLYESQGKEMKSIFILAASLRLPFRAPPANPGHGHGNGHGNRGDYSYEYDRDCPPGLAKKHNGCMPPSRQQACPRRALAERIRQLQLVPADSVRGSPPLRPKSAVPLLLQRWLSMPSIREP